MRLAQALLLIPLVAVALVSFVFVRAQQSDGVLLVSAQRQAQLLTAAGVARAVRAAPETLGGAPGVGATCTSLGRGARRNPWRCSIRYRSGRIEQYTIQVHSDGSYTGGDQYGWFHGREYHSNGQISGCCVPVP